MKKGLLTAVVATGVTALGVKTAKDKFKKFIDSPDNKRRLLDLGNLAAMGLIGKLADSISDKGIPFLNRYENNDFLEGSGYFLKDSTKEAKWLLGFHKASIVPDNFDGDLYIGGYLSYPPNKLNGIMNKQMVRAFAVDDNTGRGINVFAVIDCIGISGTDIKDIRNRLKAFISEKNIVSVNISATHCHSGIDTEGLWGELPKALKINKKAIKSGKLEDTISGKNKEFMEYLKNICADTIQKAVENMESGKLSYAKIDISSFVRDKRPPYITMNDAVCIKFVPDSGNKTLKALYMAAHATCYGDKHRQASRDFPGYFCDEMEKEGFNTMFVQGAEAAVAADRGPHTKEGLTRDESIKEYGEAIAKHILSVPDSDYKELKPLLNVRNAELLLPSDNKVLLLAAKLRLVNNPLIKISTSDTSHHDSPYDLCLATQVGYAVFGNELTLVMVPGELMPEIVIGGTLPDWASYNGTNWDYPPLTDVFGTDIAVVGLCNDFIGYIVPDNDFGSVFAPLHYEEAVSAGGRTASNIVSALIRTKEKADKETIDKIQIIEEPELGKQI